MFLDLLAQLNLLQHSPATNIIALMPLTSKAELLTTVFRELLDNKTNSKAMISGAPHLNFFYEIIGASFSLPLTHSALTQRGLDVYRNWVNEPENRPAPVDADFNGFIMTVCKQMSQFFNSEPTTMMEQEDMRNTLAVQMLAFIRQLYMSYHDQFTPEVYDVIVKVMLGIFKKYIEYVKLPDVTTEFRAELEVALYQLHEIWMLSEEMDTNLWELLWRNYTEWSDEVETITQWYALQQSLTSCVLSNLMAKQTKVAFELKWLPWHMIHSEDPFMMTLSSKYLNYAFVRFSRFLGNTITKSQKISMNATYAMKLLIETFYEYPRSVCDGNVVLRMYGDVLFQMMVINREKYEEPVNTACDTIMRVFVNYTSRTTWKPEYLADLYAGLISILDGPNPVSITVLSYPELLDLPLPGIEMLYPHYVRYINEVVLKVNPQPALRAHIYQILSKIIPRIAFYKSRPLPNITTPVFKEYTDVVRSIEDVLAKQLRDENDLQLVQDVFDVSRLFLCEMKTTSFTELLLAMLERQFSQWINSSTLTRLPSIGSSFCKLYQTTVSLEKKNTRYVISASDLLMKKYYILINESSFQIDKAESFIVDMNSLLRSVFGSLGYVPTVSFNDYSRVIDRLNTLATDASPAVADSILMFYRSIGMSNVNTMLYSHSPISELSVGISIPELLQFHSFFLASETSLVTLIDLPAYFATIPEDDKGLPPDLPMLMFIRRSHQQTVCAVKLIPYIPVPDIPTQQKPTGTPISFNASHSGNYCFKEFTTLSQMLDTNYSDKVREVLKALTSTKSPLFPVDPVQDIPEINLSVTPFPTPLSTYTVAKLCCALNIFPNETELKHIAFSESYVSNTLVQMDALATRPQYIVSIVCIGESGIIKTTKECEWFVQRLGWLVKLEEANSNLFPQELLSLQDVKELPMVTTPTEQIIFCPNSMLPSPQTQGAVWDVSDFMIIWGGIHDQSQEAISSSIIKGRPFVAIEPLPDGTYAVFNEQLIGCDYVVVSANGLIEYVMEAILMVVRRSPKTYQNCKRRQEMITNIYNSSKNLTAVDFVIEGEIREQDTNMQAPYGLSNFKLQNTEKAPIALTCLSRTYEGTTQ